MGHPTVFRKSPANGPTTKRTEAITGEKDEPSKEKEMAPIIWTKATTS
jgi:hypothetical protein